MNRFFFLIFIALPLTELMLLIKIGDVFGFWTAFWLVIGTGIVGGWAARLQGAAVLRQIRTELAEGRVPAESVIDGFLVFAGGLLLVTPGVLTDMTGICLLIPATRFWFKRWLRKKFDDFIRSPKSGPSSGFTTQFFIR